VDNVVSKETGASSGDADVLRKSGWRNVFSCCPPTVTRCGSLPRTKCRSVVSDL